MQQGFEVLHTCEFFRKVAVPAVEHMHDTVDKGVVIENQSQRQRQQKQQIEHPV